MFNQQPQVPQVWSKLSRKIVDVVAVTYQVINYYLTDYNNDSTTLSYYYYLIELELN